MVLGSRYSASTLAIREFLTRDGHPFTYLDLDADQTAQELLDRFGVSATETSRRDLQQRSRLAKPLRQRSRRMPGIQLATSMNLRFAIWLLWAQVPQDWRQQSMPPPKA